MNFAEGSHGATDLERSATDVTLDARVYDYILDRGGTISWSQASADLKASVEVLKDSIQRLKQAGKLE